ncbi:MAG: DUF4173 domain-containing protein [Ruminococcaceae bacterium]|nr:DUF4173 domain-containing protein [Oscillospiraceae bacterium]
MNYAPRPLPIPRPEPKPRPEYVARDTVFAYLCIPVCYLFVKSAPLSSPALGTAMALCFIAAFSLFYLLLSGTRPSLSARMVWLLMLTLCAGFVTNASEVLRTLLSLVLLAFLPIFAHTCCKKDFFREFSKTPLNRIADAFVTVPFAALPENIIVFIPTRKGKKSRALATIGWCLVGLVGAIIPTVIVVALLSYDAQFTSLLDKIWETLDNIFSFSNENLFEHVGDIILSCALGVGLCAVLFGNLVAARPRKKPEGTQEDTDHIPSLQVLPKPLLAAFVTPILLIYVLFFVSQWNYYVSAFTHTLPEGLTYAQYAREGFFQLCIVSVFNAVLLIILQTFMRRTPGERGVLRRTYAGIISLFTLILIATALSKMILYMDAYGMTRSRVLATWMILLLAVSFILSLIHVFCRKFPLAIGIFITCALFLLVLFLPNIDGMIADYNVDAYLSGDLSSVDVEALCDLDLAAVPALSRLEEHLLARGKLDEKSALLLEQTSAQLDRLAEWSANSADGIFDFNLPLSRAKRMLAER